MLMESVGLSLAFLLVLAGPTRSQNERQNAGGLRVGCASAAAAFSAGEFRRAADLARICLIQDDENAETHKVLALASFMLQRFDDFQSNMEKAVALNPRDGDAHYHLGRFFYETKRYGEAMNRFRLACELDSENQKAFYFSGLCRQASGDEPGAVEDFRKAIEIVERKRLHYGWPFVDLGELLINRGEFDTGLSWIYRGKRNDPTLPYTHFAYGRAVLRRETTPEVEQALQHAIKLDPGYTDAYYVLARYYSKAGDKERAATAFQKFEELRKHPVPAPFGLRR